MNAYDETSNAAASSDRAPRVTTITDRSPTVVSRRTLLAILGSAGAASLVSAGSRALAACTVTPAETEGPYWVDERLDRSDIRTDPSDGSTKSGVLLTLNVNVLRADADCVPAAGMQVDVWHCDAGGLYSDEAANGTVGKKFLRGYQVTDANGAVQFTTIFPGWYSGRTVHIHFRVRAFDGATTAFNFASQIFFDDAISNQVLALAPYNTRGTRNTTNANDNIYTAATQMAVVSDGNGGYVGTFDVALNGLPASSGGSAATPTPVRTPTPVPTATAGPCAVVAVSDPLASVVVKTRNDAGVVGATMKVALAAYAGEAVTVTLSDSDTGAIATHTVGALTALGTSGKKWRYKSSDDGVYLVTLQNLAPRRPGTFLVRMKARGWFTATAANQSAAATLLTLQVGQTCFTHAATRKIE